MRKHIWPDDAPKPSPLAEEAEKKADAKIDELKKDISQELASVLQRQRVADEKLQSFRAEMTHLIDRVITSSRQVDVEAGEETLRNAILRMLRILQRRRPQGTARELVDRLSENREGSSPGRLIEELTKMKEEGLVTLSDEQMGPETIVQIHGLGPNRSPSTG